MLYRNSFSVVFTLFTVACLAWVATASAGDSSGNMVKKSGPYTIKLELLPAEPFVSQAKAKMSENAGAMVDGKGADAIEKGGSQQPNHHLVAFIKKDGKPVEDADVKMSYQKQGSGQMMQVPVTQMWVAGKGMKTAHFGNNVKLASGDYVVQVTVDDAAPAEFDMTVQ